LIGSPNVEEPLGQREEELLLARVGEGPLEQRLEEREVHRVGEHVRVARPRHVEHARRHVRAQRHEGRSEDPALADPRVQDVARVEERARAVGGLEERLVDERRGGEERIATVLAKPCIRFAAKVKELPMS